MHKLSKISWESTIGECDLNLLPKEKGSSDRHQHGGRFSREWEYGAFIGNGMCGAMIYKEAGKGLRWELGRNDVVAHNFLEGIDWATPWGQKTNPRLGWLPHCNIEAYLIVLRG